ncbi:MAG: UPF0280 family protein [Bacteroidota bacterium]
MNAERFRLFSSVFRESDLLIGVPHAGFQPEMAGSIMEEQIRLYELLTAHGTLFPDFIGALEPLELPDQYPGADSHETDTHTNTHTDVPGLYAETQPDALRDKPELPPEIETMYRCGEATGTGPMSSVAGVFAASAAKRLIEVYNPGEVVVENGGDLFIKNSSPLLSVIHAGSSPLSDKLGLVIPPGEWGVCTSSGTLGHSYSRGRADAVTVVTESTPLADAWATSLANLVKDPDGIEPVLERVATIPAIISCVVIVGDRMGIRGEFEVKPLS